MFQKIIATVLLALSLNTMLAQTKTVNIGTTTGSFDSTYVIQTGTTDSFHVGNHPGAGGYSNAEIIVCDNATLKYNYQLGTSSPPTFYLGHNAKVIFYQAFMARFFMKSGATLDGQNNFVTAEFICKESNCTVWGASAMFYDSTYTAVNYTFTGWPNSVSPCNAATALTPSFTTTKYLLYPNPAQNNLYIYTPNLTSQEYQAFIYDAYGSLLTNQNTTSFNSQMILPINALSKGTYYLKLYCKGAFVDNFRFSVE
jgi:hypothetical protein